VTLQIGQIRKTRQIQIGDCQPKKLILLCTDTREERHNPGTADRRHPAFFRQLGGEDVLAQGKAEQAFLKYRNIKQYNTWYCLVEYPDIIRIPPTAPQKAWQYPSKIYSNRK
jgi:hypothetical protein